MQLNLCTKKKGATLMVGKGTVNKRAVYARPLLAMQQMRESPRQD